MSLQDDLIIEQIQIGPMQNFAYLVGCKRTREVAVVDPAWDIEGLLNFINEMVTEECEARGIPCDAFRFSRRDLREYTHWGNSQVAVHLDRLVDYEYLTPHTGRRGQTFVYECLYEGQGRDGATFFMGLIDTEELKAGKAKG